MAESSVRQPPAAGYYEFFAGGGMVRAGLGDGWRCLFANDFDPAKAAAYRANWGDDGLRLGDIGGLTAADLPGSADLMWGSFPCQDLSLAGAGAGLGGKRSGTFHDFWALARSSRDAAADLSESRFGFENEFTQYNRWSLQMLALEPPAPDQS